MKYLAQPFSGLVQPHSGNSAEHLFQNFALAEVRAHLTGSKNEQDNAFRAANVSLALAMEKYAYYQLLEQEPNIQRARVRTESVDMGYSSNGEKLLEISVVRTGFYTLDDHGEMVQHIPTNFICDHTGILVALPEQTQADYSLGRFRNPVSIEHAFQDYAMRIGCPDLSFENFTELRVSSGQNLLAAQPCNREVA